MKIKKGTEVRIRRTSQIATIQDVELIRKGGKVHKYCHLKTKDGQPDLWMDSTELADVVECCSIDFWGQGDAKVGTIKLKYDHTIKKMNVRQNTRMLDYAKEDLLPLMMHQLLINVLKDAGRIELIV